MRKIPLWWWLLVVVAMFLLAGPLIHAQDIYVPACSTNYSCQVTTSQPWATGNQTWIFAPIAPNVSIYVYVHNRNTTSAHTSQTLQIFQTGSTTVSSLSSGADQWAQDAVQQNTIAGASCNNLNANAPLTPGASGTGTCYVSTMATAQVAIKMTGAASAAGSPDTFDIGIVQIAGYAAGPQPGAGEQVVTSSTTPTTPADNTSNTAIPGNQSYQMVFDGINWDRATEPTGDAVSNSGITGVGPVLWNGTNYDRWAEQVADGGSVAGKGAVIPSLFNGTTFDRQRSQSSNATASSAQVGSSLPGVSIVTAPADWSSAVEGTASACSASVAAQPGFKHCATGVLVCVVATIAQASLFAELKDGVTLRWAGAVAGTAGTFGCAMHEFSGGPICGTTNTALTLALSAATSAGNTCASTLKGYDVQ